MNIKIWKKNKRNEWTNWNIWKKFDRALQEKVNQIKNEYHMNHVNKELEKIILKD